MSLDLAEAEAKLSKRLLEAIKINPLDCRVFEHQLAGHGSQDETRALLGAVDTRGRRVVLKPIVGAPPKCLRELAFYLYLASLHAGHPLRRFCAEFYGTASATGSRRSGAPRHFLVLQDLAPAASSFSAMDVKVGTKTYSPDDPPAKIAQITAKYPFQEELGLRICGMRVYHHGRRETTARDSAWGKTVRPKTLGAALALFFDCGLPRAKLAEAAAQLLARLRELQRFFRAQKELEFRSSSLLLFYALEGGAMRASVHMVDFCHAHNAAEVDWGYLKGLDLLVREVNRILNSFADEQ